MNNQKIQRGNTGNALPKPIQCSNPLVFKRHPVKSKIQIPVAIIIIEKHNIKKREEKASSD